MKKRVIILNVRKIVLPLVGLEPTTLFNALICYPPKLDNVLRFEAKDSLARQKFYSVGEALSKTPSMMINSSSLTVFF